MKSISESVRGMAVVIASVMLAATIFTMPVKAAEPATYVQSGTIWSESAGEHVVLIMNSNGTPDKFSDDSIDDILWSEDEVD